jgi:hypothetical protein
MARGRNGTPHEIDPAKVNDLRRRHLLNDISHLGLPWRLTIDDGHIPTIKATFHQPGESEPKSLGLATFWTLDGTAGALGAAEFAVIAVNSYQDHVKRIAALEEALRKDRALLETLTAPESEGDTNDRN